MANDGIHNKNQNQRKRRQERETCINNVKINLNRTSLNSRNPNRHHPQQIVDNNTYTRHRSRNRFQRGSLENVSSNPWGELRVAEQSTLRRSRSLAIARDDIFNNLEVQTSSSGQGKPRRAQLIPRAKLIERNTIRDQRPTRGSSVENLPLIKRKSSPIFTDLHHSLQLENPTGSITKSRQDHQHQEFEFDYPSIRGISPKFEQDQQHPHDSLDSNYYNKTSLNTNFRVSYDDLPGLSLPNYYPDSKYDTDDNISGTDIISTESYGDNNSKKYSSCDNLSTTKWTNNELESISYDDNIVLSTNRPLYDSIKENHYAKPKTIRGPTPYKRDQTFYYNEKRKSLPSSSSDTSTEKQNLEEDKISLDYFETDSNFDEIKLNNEQKLVASCENLTTDNQNSVDNPPAIIEEIKQKEEPIEEQPRQVEVIQPDEQFKTIVTVESESKTIESEEERLKEEEENKHSHNYLKEFIESQKGSRKPLQNFISKKLSNLSRKNSKDLTTNLTENQYHSLPDITISKNLRKCEKIDRKLRKCDKNCSLSKRNRENNESRFIVNIGKHFDITANSNVPVDFELKIAKVPRKTKISARKSKTKSDEQFLAAVKNLKETLNNHKLDENHNITKPEVIEIKTKTQVCESGDKEEQEITMDIRDDCVKEYKEKLGTMRNYWGKMVNGNDNEPEAKCKIVDVQTKVEDVKKKFEPPPPQVEKPNKVLAAKQLFEKIDRTRKIAPIIKETSNYFETNTKNRYHNTSDNQFESLNPCSVEIVNRDESILLKTDNNKHKTVAKSISVNESPEFDHVRYRVVKSDLFQKKIFANCEKESQFDGLMQYLQDYSFQELLYDNNIVIIEPIRSKIPHETSKTPRTTKNITPLFHKNIKNDTISNSNLRRHFFYHPIRVNKEVNDDELPNPDTVKQVRQFFEGGLIRSQSSQEFEGPKQITRKIDPDKDQCSGTDSNSTNISDFGSQENLFAITGEHCCEQQYVSEDILEKIRECGTTVTYYGGQVVKKQCGQPILTKAIMEEIKNNEKRILECSCKKQKEEKDEGNKETYQGVKFKLVKSNSCSSRLELVGTTDLKAMAKRHKHLQHNNNFKHLKEINESSVIDSNGNGKKLIDKNAINETIKKTMEENNSQPKIIGEEKKILTQWGDTAKEKTYNKINFSEKKIYNYHNYDNMKKNKKKIDEMEFEPYEVA